MLLANYQKPKPPKKDSVPTKKDLLLQKYERIKGLPSPHYSSSEGEDESDQDVSDSESDAEQAAAGLEFDSDESDSGDEARSDDEGE